MTPNLGEKRLTGQQKTGFVLLLVFGVLVVSLGFLQMRNTIYGPFTLGNMFGDNQASQMFLDEQTRLQSIDTDRDGIKDYEELNFYETSPYLPDTDSDGIDDGVEIEQGTNPLCVEGENCGQTATDIPAGSVYTSTSTNGSSELPGGAEADTGFEFLNGENTDIFALLQDPKLLRQLLLETGKVTSEQLEGVEDAQLLEMVQDILASQ